MSWLEWIRTNRVPLSFSLLAIGLGSLLVWYVQRQQTTASVATTGLDQEVIELLQKLRSENDQLLTQVEELKTQVSEASTQPAVESVVTPAVAGAKKTTPSSVATSKVNLNSADLAALETLPGIGPSKAAAIIDYRTANGPFKNPADLKNVKGIGEKTYESLAPLVTVN